MYAVHVPSVPEIFDRLRAAPSPAEGAVLCEQGIAQVSRAEDPDTWGILHASLANAAGRHFTQASLEAVLGAYRSALSVWGPDRNPELWTVTLVNIGHTYLDAARSGVGDPQRHVEDAIDAFGRAAQVAPEDTPDAWLSANYENAAAWRIAAKWRGDVALEQSASCYRRILAKVRKEESPDEWVSLRVALAQTQLDRGDGDRQGRIEEAIMALEEAVELTKDPAPPGTLRLLAGAYLERAAGDPAENVDRGIAALEASLNADVPSADLNSWAVAQANLGQAYIRRQRGKRRENLAKATAALTAVASMPLDEAGFPQGWGSALAWLTLLSLHDPDRDFSAESAPRETREDYSEQGRFTRVIDAVAAREVGREPLMRDSQWHVPFLLEDASSVLQGALIAFLDTGNVPTRGDAERARFESRRHADLKMAVAHLAERRSATTRTRMLLAEIQGQGRPFVLYLRGFNNRMVRYETGLIVSGTGNLEWFALRDLVADVSPMPVVWIANPVESPTSILLGDDRDYGFRIESGEEWERHVQSLISAATFIAVNNTDMSPGVVTEIGFLGRLGRLGDAFFYDPDAAGSVIGQQDCRSLDASALAAIRSAQSVRMSPLPLPAANQPWVDGQRRAELERQAEAAELLMKRLQAAGRPALRDLLLDVASSLLGQAVLLERDMHVRHLLLRRAELLRTREESPAWAQALAEECLKLAAELTLRNDPSLSQVAPRSIRNAIRGLRLLTLATGTLSWTI